MKILYCIHPPKKREDKPVFRRVGAGFMNRDGSVNIVLDHQPGVTYQLRNLTEGSKEE